MNGELPLHPSDEERVAAAMARELESVTTTTIAQPGEGFADRVMLAIADEPLPQPVRAFGLALLAGHFRAAASAVGDAWRTISSGPAPMFVRAQALALVLVVLLASLTLAGGATVGAMGLFGNGPVAPAPSGLTPSVPVARPTPSPLPQVEDTPSASPEESTDGEASETPDATETPEATETQDPQETERATTRPRTAEPTEDHSGDGSGSGSGSDGGDQTPSPTETSTDHSGSDG